LGVQPHPAGPSPYGAASASVSEARYVLPDGRHVRVRWAKATLAGLESGGHKKTNQDAYLILPGFRGSRSGHVFGVMDGHGADGHMASGYIKREFKGAFRPPPPGSNARSVAAELKRAMLGLHRGLVDHRIDFSLSGSTAVIVYLEGTELYVANVGDSRAVLASQKPREPRERGVPVTPLGPETQGPPPGVPRMVVTPLSEDHKPELPEERQRIVKAGGEVRRLALDSGEEVGPHRVFVKGGVRIEGVVYDIPGLAMSRALGDVIAHNVGVSAEPDVLTKTLAANDKFIIIASDGVWEFIESEEAVEIVASHLARPHLGLDLTGAAQVLCDEARKRWANEEHISDDITAVLVGIDLTSSSQANGHANKL